MERRVFRSSRASAMADPRKGGEDLRRLKAAATCAADGPRLRLAQGRSDDKPPANGLNLPLLRPKTAAYGHRGDEDPQGGPTRCGHWHMARRAVRGGQRPILQRL